MALFMQGYRLYFLSMASRLRTRNGFPFLLSYSKRNASMKIMPAEPPPKESYEDKNIRLKRPLSPHVDIYAMRMQTALSLSHRISGIFINSYVVLFALGSFFMETHTYEVIRDFLYDYDIPEPVYLLGKFALALPFCYHLNAGCRHMIWDFTGNYLRLPAIMKSGYILIAMTIITTIIALLMSFPKKIRMARCRNDEFTTPVKPVEVQTEQTVQKLAERRFEEYSNKLDPQVDQHFEELTQKTPQVELNFGQFTQKETREKSAKYKPIPVSRKIQPEAEIRFEAPDSKP